jgi:hypothetical protein
LLRSVEYGDIQFTNAPHVLHRLRVVLEKTQIRRGEPRQKAWQRPEGRNTHRSSARANAGEALEVRAR